MIVKSGLKVGGVTYQFEVDEKDEMDALHKAIALANPKAVCTNCQNADLETKTLTTNKDKEGNTYVNLKCKCGARSKLGRYKVGGFFWNDYEMYIPGEKK